MKGYGRSRTKRPDGHIRRRGRDSWEIKYEGPPATLGGTRKTHYRTFKGTEEQARTELARILLAIREKKYVEPSNVTVAELAERFERDWIAAEVSPKTGERYREILKLHVVPHLGKAKLSELRRKHLEELYAKLLRQTHLAPRTVGHVHRVLHRALTQAVAWELIGTNPAAAAKPPRIVDEDEPQILNEIQIRAVLNRLRGRPFYMIAALALATGCRRGELLALRWKEIDLDGARLRVERSLEQTKDGLRFKPPKTKHGRRSMSLPATLVAELRAHWKEQQETRIALGLGRSSGADLVLGNHRGEPRKPNVITKEWTRLATELGHPDVNFHALRHTHASQLIASGMDVLTISRRLGHASAVITLKVYGHLFSNTDDQAAKVMEAAFAKARTD